MSDNINDLISRQDAIDAISIKIDEPAKGDIGRFYNGILRQAIEAIKCVPSAQQWIPCSERLPAADVLPFEKLGDTLMVKVDDLKEFNRVILSQGTWCRTFYEGEE